MATARIKREISSVIWEDILSVGHRRQRKAIASKLRSGKHTLTFKIQRT